MRPQGRTPAAASGKSRVSYYIQVMRYLMIWLTALCLTAPPATAQEDGPSLMERGAQQFLEGLLQEMEPAWQQMQGFMEQMGPAMLELMEEVKDWSVYEPPEVLDNGDIIIRRKPPVDVAPPDRPDQQTEI